MPVWDHAALIDVRERLEKLEADQQAMVRELWAGLQQLRSEVVIRETSRTGGGAESPKKKSSFWRFLWGD